MKIGKVQNGWKLNLIAKIGVEGAAEDLRPIPNFDLEKKKFMKLPRRSVTPRSFYLTPTGIAKLGRGIRIAEMEKEIEKEEI
jgi:hypothetical protein